VQPGLAVVGHCTIDDIHCADGRDFPATMGGAAAYATLGARLTGGSATLITVLGDDYPLEKLRSGLASVGGCVDTSHSRTIAGRSIHNDAWYSLDGARRFDVESWERLEALTPLPSDLPLEELHGAIVLLTPASVWQQEALVDALAPIECRVALDTEIHYLTDDSTRRRLLALAGRTDLFLPSIEHLKILFDSPSDEALDYAPRLEQLGCPVVAVKRGVRGSCVFDWPRTTTQSLPALEVEVVDSTGAGDGFGGGFLSALARGLGTTEAACWGTVAASFVVESIGASLPAHFTAELAQTRFDRLRLLLEGRPLSSRRAQGVSTT
jgi:sugar/nucleoside kinase (ribokinase family)